jgi:DNA helicase TIP49 (TBP-interacting protein)
MWGDFIVDKVEEIEWDDSCFGKLQIDLDLKSNLESLVSQYSTTDSCFKDILKGKSKGLTILLRGPPGSGKTLTAGK